MRCRTDEYARGFTLVEVIVTLLIVAVLGTMFYTYFGKSITESVTSVTGLKHSSALHRVMQNITADCNVYPRWRSGTLYAAGAYATPRNFNGRYYKCTAGGTSHATDEPAWPLTSGGTMTDGTVTWTESGRLRALLPLTTLQTRIGAEGSDQATNEYGKNSDGTYTTYNVASNRFVQFVNNAEVDDAENKNNILKVTLKNDRGETLTVIFVSD